MDLVRVAAMRDELSKIAKELTEGARDKIKAKNFAEPGKRKYPIEDKAHAQNALARVSQFGSASEKAQVREKVHAKYPEIGKDKQSSLVPPPSVVRTVREKLAAKAALGRVAKKLKLSMGDYC